MDAYFLDTSAIVKRYVSELGHSWVASLCDLASGNAVTIAQAALVEIVATFCRKARETDLTQHISETERDHPIALFCGDVRRQYSVIQVTTAVYARAGDLCRKYRLRAYDAIQLACALTVSDRLTPQGIDTIFMCADTHLLGIAAAQGLRVDDPQAHL